MDLKSSFNKFKIYFVKNHDYWRLCDHSPLKVKLETGPFFLNLTDRLKDGHYNRFDSEGFPVRIHNGEQMYNYTTICSYALAHWQLFVESGDESHTRQLFKTVDFLRLRNERTDYGGTVFPFKGRLSAMNQGEALSVVARAFEFSKDSRLVDFASDILKAYEFPVDKYGIVGRFSNLADVYWYEERAEIPHKHILNGMIYSLIGLRDISTAMPHLHKAKSLWHDGLRYLKEAIHLYDNGFWSWYWVDEAKPNYIASVMYHNLHICQLTYLHQVSGIPELKQYAEKFLFYYGRPTNRLRSGLDLLKGKFARK